MWLNSTAKVAIRSVIFIAEKGGDAPVRVDDVAAALNTPRNYLSKTLHALTKAGVLRSFRGPKGGFRLIDPAEELPLAKVIAAFAPANDRRCLIGRPKCGDARPCLAHDQWSKVTAGVDDFFSHTTVADLMNYDPELISL